MTHMRAKHGVRNEFRKFAPLNGICPVCSACFFTRIRLHGHLSDRRRPACADLIRSNPCNFLLDDQTIQAGDEQDRLNRKDARTHGLSRPSAVGIVLRDGKSIGRARSAV